MEENPQSKPDDSKYEFDCPQFVDFADLGDDDNADEWFENHDEDDEQVNFFTDSGAATDTRALKWSATDEGDTTQEDEHPVSSSDSDAIVPERKEEADTVEDGGHPVSPTTVAPVRQEERDTSEEEVRPAPSKDSEAMTEVTQEPEISGEELASNVKPGNENQTKSEHETSEESAADCKPAKKKQPTPAKTLRRSMRKRKPSNLVTSWDHVKHPVTVHYNDGTSAKASSGNVAHKSLVNGSNLKTTEQMELERIEEAKKALEKSRQMSQHSLQMVRASRSYTPTKSIQPPTKPHEFRFKTDNRLKFTKEQEREKEELEKQRKARKRSKATRRPVIKAPLLTATRKRVTDTHAQGPPVKAVKTVALQLREFQNKTPDRFHSKPINEQNKGPCPPKSHKLGLTIPHSPALTTLGRKRPITVISAAEQEEKELEEIKKYKFKANPVDSRIYSTSSSNTSMRSSSSKDSKEEQEEKFEFHARPIPAKMLEGVTGVGKAKQIPVTCPKSPAFALKNRIRPKEPEPPKEEEVDHMIKARPLPHLGVPFKPNLHHKTTTPAPFSFADRDRETQAKKEAKVQEIYKQEQEARIFHAQPLPDQKEQVGIPVKKSKPTTKPAPFNLEGENNGAKRAEKWAEELEKELQEQKKRCSSFRARPANVLYQEPFKPDKTNKPLTDISDFQLNTERRAEEREDFDRKRYEMESQKMAVLEQQRQLEEEEEQKNIAKLRSELVHKAQPIHRFKGVCVQPSDKPLTMAESPRFSDRRRSKMDM
ncbi:targeting protein for Xklp2 homolog [Apostichopus japonicus]|uniref:targeting protein for Xklp2 homolog n=1 Tax=Stichopus japonicus TaxID=307972 RepID=UPI003AB5BFCA